MRTHLQSEWPPWWDWELELPSHLMKRMLDRGFNELDLRLMMSTAVGYREDHEAGRWIIQTQFESGHWEIVVEPDATDCLLVVITAYPVDAS